ncbi:MAG: NHLP bacteriocin export ABC transporter permease/ATPase subunit [Holophaga sp.]|nr:NHLP bacteriocin export ABC transporter permease/ATPase subunit [Holophaga sp.]
MTDAQLNQLQNLPLPARVPATDPWELRDEGAFWVVVQGRVEVFAQRRRPAEPEGSRHHLFGFQPGDVLRGLGFQAEHGDLKVVAVAVGDTRLLAGTWDGMPGPARTDLGEHLLGAFAEAVLAGVARHVVADGQPPVETLLRPGQSAALGARGRCATPEALSWVRVQEGEGFLLGDPACPLDAALGPFPLARGLWLAAGAAGATVQCLPAEELPDWNGWNPVLARMLPCLMALEARRCAREDREELARLTRKLGAELDRRHRSLFALATLTAPEAEQPPPAARAGALLDACRMVGQHAGIVFHEPPQWVLDDPSRDRLAAICRASRVRLRRVALRGAWWEKDAGALLGTLGEARTPVALVPRARGGYLLREGPDQPPVVLDAGRAAQLDPFAYAFYRPGPAGTIRARDLGRMVWKHIRGDLGWVLAMAMVSGLVSLALPVTLGLMMTSVIPQANPSAIWALFLALVGLTLSGGLFDLTRGMALLRVEGKAATTLQAAVIDRLLTLPVAFFRGYAVGDLALRATAVDQAHALLSGAAVTGILSAVFSGFNFALLFYYQSQLAWVALALAAVLVACYSALAWARGRIEAERQRSSGELSGLVFQLLSGVAKLRVAAAEGRAFAVWCERLWGNRLLEVRMNGYLLAFRVLNEVLPIVSLLAVFGALQVFLLESGASLQSGAFLAFNSAFAVFIASAVALSTSLMDLQQIKPLFDCARPILETVPEEDLAKPDPGRLRGRIEANHLSFRYSPDGPQILQDVSFHADPGEFVAFVGASGCGKSTTLRLLLGFERPETGAIYYDQQDLSAVDIGSLRSQLGVVLQSSKLLGGSIWQNIVGASTLTLEDAWAAAEAAGFAGDVRDMPMGMHTVVSEGGGTLSGGQRQRLLIARALVRKPRIILFDEATSALDNRTQAIVSRSLERSSATRIVIAHRLSTIQNADRIYVFDRGRIVQEGNYADLVGQPGLFRHLALRQIV